VKAGEGGSGGQNGAEEKGKEGTQQGREGSMQEGEARGEGEVIIGYRLRPAPSNHCGWGELMQPEGIQELQRQ